MNVQALKAEMVRMGYTQANLAEKLGITPRTFSTRLRTGDFGCTEMKIMIKELNLKKPADIFFAD